VVGAAVTPFWIVMISRRQLDAGLDPVGALGVEMTLNLIAICVTIAYSTWMNGRWGATVGKMAIGAKIVNSDLTPISYGKALARALAEFLSGLVFLIGYIMAAFDGKKRALHDQICGTLVVARI
jgi:uncharacterized RDD family membrane protein YckC